MYEPVKPKHLKCIQCGKCFKGTHNKKYCSRQCLSEHHLAKHRVRPKSEWIAAICKECGIIFNRDHPSDVSCQLCRAKRRVGAKVVCEYCSETFTITQHQRNTPRFCSNVCSGKANRTPECSKVRFIKCRWCDELMQPRQLSGLTCSDKCATMMTRVHKWASDRSIKTLDAIQPYKQAISERACRECDGTFTPTTAGRAYCSDKCSKRYYGRVGRATRAAKRKSIHPMIDRIDPFRVFKRDGWQCYICGTRTPKKHRNTLEPNAPELEHIIPLSKGGPHTEHNVACACRSCNQHKSDTLSAPFRLVTNEGFPLQSRR